MAPISLTLCSKPDLLHTDDDLEILRALSRQLVLSYVLKSQNETPNNAFTVAGLAAGCAELRLFLSWASDCDNAGPVPVSPDHHQFERPLLSAASSHATLVDTRPLRAGREKSARTT